MHQRGYGRQLLAALTTVVVVGAAVPATAYHSGEERVVNDTAHTLRPGDVRASLWTLDVGILEGLQVSTIYLANLLQVYNGGVKWRFWKDGPVALSAKLELAYINFENWPVSSTSPATGLVAPFELAGSWQLGESWGLHLASVWTQIQASATPDSDALQGAAGVDNLQLVFSVHWRLSRITTMYARGRQLMFQEAGGAVDVTQEIDDKTTAHIVAEGDTDAVDFGGARSLVVGAIWSGRRFNLRAGVGYGNWSLPVVNFVTPKPLPIVDLDLYFRF
jgi:hypothetical protein